MQLGALRRIGQQAGVTGPSGADQHYAQQLTSLELGVLDLTRGIRADQRRTLLASNVYAALTQSTRDIIESIGKS